MTAARSLLAPFGFALLAVAGLYVPGVAGQALLYPLLGVAPGMAAAQLLAGPGGPRWTLGLALAPLVSTMVAAPLVALGLPQAWAAGTVAAAGLLLWGLLAWLRAPRAADPVAGREPAADLRFLLPLAVGVAVLASLPWLVNPWLRVRSDAWIHGGLVWEIVHHGLAPEDPRFAGLRLNYVWFFNFFIALLTSLTRRDPFVFMMLFNTLNFGVCIALVYRLALTLWRDRVAAAGAAILVPVGLNAGTWLLWPLWLVRAFTGRIRGWAEVIHYVQNIRWGTCDMIFTLSAPFAYMVSVFDKFTVGTALSYTWLLMILYLWALIRWLDSGRRGALAWAAIAAAGMLFFHGVVGLSVIPVALGALALAWLASFRWTWLPTRGRLAALAAATLAGALAALPYTRSISSGWAAGRSGFTNHYFHLGLWMIWTLATSLAVVAILARRPLARLLRERHPAGTVLVLFTAGMILFSVIVHLPLDNESKFVFQVFFPLAVLAGPGLPTLALAARRRLGPVAGSLALALLFLLAPIVLLASYAADPAGRRAAALNPAPGERVLYAWIRAHVPTDAFLTDRGGRDLVMVEAQRRLWVGTISSPEMAAFPAPEMAARRAVQADLYGAADSLDADARALARLGRPAYVLFRPADDPRPQPWQALESRPDLFARVYAADGFRLYRLRSGR